MRLTVGGAGFLREHAFRCSCGITLRGIFTDFLQPSTQGTLGGMVRMGPRFRGLSYRAVYMLFN